MKTLIEYIKESLEDDVFWLLDKWFERNEEQRSEFVEILVKCLEDKVVQTNKIKEYLKGTTLEKDLKQFVNFIDNEVSPVNEKDYEERLKVIIKQILDYKSRSNRYVEQYKSMF